MAGGGGAVEFRILGLATAALSEPMFRRRKRPTSERAWADGKRRGKSSAGETE
jgi:hypothetical protein